MSTAWVTAPLAGKFVGPVPQGDPAAVRSPGDGTSGVSTGPATPIGLRCAPEFSPATTNATAGATSESSMPAVAEGA